MRVVDFALRFTFQSGKIKIQDISTECTNENHLNVKCVSLKHAFG